MLSLMHVLACCMSCVFVSSALCVMHVFVFFTFRIFKNV